MFCTQTLPGNFAQACADAIALLHAKLSRRTPMQTAVVLPSAIGTLSSALSDEACMVRYQQGDTTAFRVLYTRYRDKLHRYTLRLANRHSEAEEVFQEVWLAVIRGKDTYRANASFAAWLFAIAHRRAADRWRTLGRHAPDWQNAGDDDGDVFEQAAVQETPERSVYNDALRSALLDAVQLLPLPQREAFLLRAEGDLSVQDIAIITGVTRETAKSRLRYAQRRLRDALEAWR